MKNSSVLNNQLRQFNTILTIRVYTDEIKSLLHIIIRSVGTRLNTIMFHVRVHGEFSF